MSLSNKTLRLSGYAALFIIQLICASILLGGVSMHGQYGPGNVCLFFISNYHIEASSYVFRAGSSECTNLIALGSFALVMTLVLGTLFLLYGYKDQTRPSSLSLVTAVLASLFAIVTLVGAATASAGLAKTCSEFEGLTGGDCKSVFDTGFLFDGDVSKTYYPNLSVLFSAVNAAWVLTIAWTAYAGLEWFNWHSENSKWW